MCLLFFLTKLVSFPQKMQSVQIWHIPKHYDIVHKFTSGISHFTSIRHGLLQWHGHVILVVIWKLNLTSKLTWVMTKPITVDWIHELYAAIDKAQKRHHTNGALGLLARPEILRKLRVSILKDNLVPPLQHGISIHTFCTICTWLQTYLTFQVDFTNQLPWRDTHRQGVGRPPL